MPLFAPIAIKQEQETPIAGDLYLSRSPATIKYDTRREARMCNIAHQTKTYALR
jgi:hypothetical protein